MAAEGTLELSLLLCGERAMARLNRSHRGRSGPTDVLSFPLEDSLAGPYANDPRAPCRTHLAHLKKEIARRRKNSAGAPLALGDVAICVPIARRQARELGETLEAAYRRLLVHGICHLLGYDHERGPAWERAMDEVERGLIGF